MQIAAMLRVKNEARWIAEVIDSLARVCSPIIVMDDHSDDETAAICEAHGAIVYPSPYEGIDEARDKDWLLRKVEAHCEMGSYVLCIDGDEVLEPNGPDKVRAMASTGVDAFKFKVLYLWDSREQVRTDGVYSRFARPSMFRLQPGMSFKRTGSHANFHCSSVPAAYLGRCMDVNISLLHLGYMDRADRLRKYEWYNRIDPGNRVEDGYRHIVQGDIPEVPAHARLAHAGPLKLIPYEAAL